MQTNKPLSQRKPGPSWSYGANKTDHHDITEILLKVALDTITPPPKMETSCERTRHNAKYIIGFKSHLNLETTQSS